MTDGDFGRVRGLLSKQAGDNRSDMGEKIGAYTDLFDKQSAEDRKGNYESVVNKYYDLATDFYEIGWGTSFHFAPRHRWETLDASIARHEYWLASRMGLKEGMKVMDVGCGVGGPLRNIARFSKAQITGLNNNEYQVGRAKRLAADARMGALASYIKGDFMNIPSDPNSYDAVYAIESTCHAPDRVGVYSQIFKILKPGGVFAAYEWVTTPDFDPSNEHQVALKKGIERGNGLPDLEPIDVIVDALKKAGFEVVEHFDLAPKSEVPWYLPLVGRLTPSGLAHTRLGRWLALNALKLAEYVKVAPAGATNTLDMLQKGGDALVLAGQEKIFTPMWWILARKPE